MQTVEQKEESFSIRAGSTEERRAWDDPDTVLHHLNLNACAILADIGCGTGWFTLAAARKMAPGGYVYAVDISEEMLNQVRQKAREADLGNIEPVLAEEEDEYPIPTGSVDMVLIADLYHEVDPATNFLGEIRRILKPGGTCFVVDWRQEETSGGPPLEQRVDQQDVTEEFYSSGFILAGTCDVGPHHYGLKFQKVGNSEPNQPDR